jgi:8-amino-7-oxononanoate synthase
MTSSERPRGLSAATRQRALDLARKGANRQRNRASETEPQSKTQRFEDLQSYKNLRQMRQIAGAFGVAWPYFLTHDGHASTMTSIEGQECLNFSSYDYLGLNADPRPMNAAKIAIDKYGLSASASRMVAGQRPIHLQLEARLAAHYGAQDALTFVSGHATNVSVIGCLMQEGDVVIHDSLVHNSVTAGIQQSGAARRSFLHNDMDALERVLNAVTNEAGNVMVVVEGLYSMDGDIADLPAILELKERYGFWLMVDEAHALGCVGLHGRGSFEHHCVDPAEVDIWMGTFSKSLSATGGYIAGSAALIEILKHNADGFVYSVAMPPALAAAADCALELLQVEPDRAERLRDNGLYFLKRAASLKFDCGTAQGHAVCPVMIGDSLMATKLSNRLLECGINVAPVTFPGVAMHKARLRFFLTSEHTHAQIDTALTATRTELDRLKDEGLSDILQAALTQLQPHGGTHGE